MAHLEFEKKSFDGLSLFFQSWNVDEGQKGVICLVHGLGEHSGRYADWASMFNHAGYSVVSYDLRGHGKSGGKRGHVKSFDDYLQDTDLLFEETRERFLGVPCFLYGHSLGGLIVIYYVLRQRPTLAGVIISALSNKTSLQEQKAKVLLSKVLGSVVPKLTIQTGLIPATISRDPEVVSRYINDPLVHHEVSVGWGKSALEAIPWMEQHAMNGHSVLFMHGEKDILGYAEGSREFSSRSRAIAHENPGLFHEVHNEPEKDQVFEYVRHWLVEH
jgi:alpha-beta hydrolase superfamily lysophospholipase